MSPFFGFFVVLVPLNILLAYLLFIWLRYTLADAQRGLRWTAVAAAAWPWTIFLVLLVESHLGGKGSGGAWFAFVAPYAIAAMAVVTKEA
jgi:hypothetical protein